MNAARSATLARVLAVLGITSKEPVAALDKQIKALDAALDALLKEHRDVAAVEAAVEGNTLPILRALTDARHEIEMLKVELAGTKARWSNYADNVQNIVADMPHNGHDCTLAPDGGPAKCFACRVEDVAATRPEECDGCCGCTSPCGT